MTATPRPWQVAGRVNASLPGKPRIRPVYSIKVIGHDMAIAVVGQLVDATLIVEAVNQHDTLTAENAALREEARKARDERDQIQARFDADHEAFATVVHERNGLRAENATLKKRLRKLINPDFLNNVV